MIKPKKHMQHALKKYNDHITDSDTQQRLNQPLQKDDGMHSKHDEFLKLLISKLESSELDPLNIQTIYNPDVYNNLNEEEKEKTNLVAVNIMSIIRQIESLWKIEQKSSFQIQNLVDTVFQMKAKFEEKHGDVYII